MRECPTSDLRVEKLHVILFEARPKYRGEYDGIKKIFSTSAAAKDPHEIGLEDRARKLSSIAIEHI